ncbi:hypothetical protein HB732_21445 [Pseudomonas aeruginosa]|uniref:FGGY-family carbohydrate kinase n=77 Tax=Pseudomonas aeruginosa TaxID=287 RepID=UPI0020B3BBA2|nr:FGGY-family carbohydrate kinase [Pseudomonas aeruginosa]NRC38536.1 hypothetical protein [Pseudomonas aeruginosa]
MATTLKPVDAVVVGFGWTGAILAKELTEAGLNVVALERGENRDTYPDGAYPNTLDELTYNTRGKLFQNLSKSTVSIRHGINDTALPYRQLSAFLPGDGVGGAGLHWSGVHFRIMPEELRLRSHYEERYGKKFIPEGMTIQDYGVSYEELEPHFDFAEKVFGTSGTAHTVKGQVVGKGNPFAADRSDDFPLPALRQVYSAQLFRKAAEELGLHPYDLPAANASGPWTNPYGVQMGPCNFCGFCSGYACYMYSKASPNLNILPALRQTPLFELRANCNVLKVNLDSDGRQATGVTYVDAQGREIVQPAKLVIISAFQFHNVRLLLLSGIGKPYDPRTGEGVVGKNFAYQNMATIKAFFDKDVHTNPFVGTGGGGVAVDDFNADNFDHGPLGFVGGSPMWVNQAGSKPIGGLAVPPGTPSWGSGWKQAVKDAYTHTVSMDAHGSNMTYRDNYLDHWLTGRVCSEAGDASGSGYFDVRRRTWASDVLELVEPGGRLAAALPELIEPGACIGNLRPEAAAALGLAPHTRVACGGGDNMLAAIGTGNIRPGLLTASLGTSGTLSAYAERPLVSPHGELATFCASSGGWLPLACTMNLTGACGLVQDLLHLDLDEFSRLAAQAPVGAEGLLMLPFFDGERVPALPHASASLHGMTAANLSRANLCRAVLEGTAFGLRYGLDLLRASGLPGEEIRLVGGAAKNPLWRRTLADLLGLPLVCPRQTEAAALGAALQAAWSLGRESGAGESLEALCRRCVALDESTRTQPQARQQAAYEQAYRRYLEHLPPR